MSKARILVVEDDPDIRELLSYTLGKEGYEVLSTADGDSGLAMALNRKPDLIILDVMMPGLDGLQVLKRIKADEKTRLVPVLMASAKGEDADVVTGLELGAEDYVTKPYSPRVLVARVRTALRRSQHEKPASNKTILSASGIVLDPAMHQVTAGSTRVDLSATEFQLLALLMRHPGRVYERSAIIDSVKGGDYPASDRSVDVQIVSLRRKLGEYGSLVETVRGVGYRFADEGNAR